MVFPPPVLHHKPSRTHGHPGTYWATTPLMEHFLPKLIHEKFKASSCPNLSNPGRNLQLLHLIGHHISEAPFFLQNLSLFVKFQVLHAGHFSPSFSPWQEFSHRVQHASQMSIHCNVSTCLFPVHAINLNATLNKHISHYLTCWFGLEGRE